MLTCISLKINNVENLSTCFLAISISSLEKSLFISSAYFFIGLFVFLPWSCMSCLYIWRLNPCWSLGLQVFSPILWVVFSFCLWFPLLCKIFLSLIRTYFIIFIFINPRDEYKKILLQFIYLFKVPRIFILRSDI